MSLSYDINSQLNFALFINGAMTNQIANNLSNNNSINSSNRQTLLLGFNQYDHLESIKNGASFSKLFENAMYFTSEKMIQLLNLRMNFTNIINIAINKVIFIMLNFYLHSNIYLLIFFNRECKYLNINLY